MWCNILCFDNGSNEKYFVYINATAGKKNNFNKNILSKNGGDRNCLNHNSFNKELKQ